MSEGNKTPKGEVPPNKKPVKEDKEERSSSPQPSTSTSTASTPSTSSGSSRGSVYSHIEGLDELPHLRSFRAGRRRSAYRLIGKAKLARQYEHAIQILGPIFAEETRRQEEAATLVAAAIEHFAITVNSIADQLEGITPVNEDAANLDDFQRLQQSEIDKRKLEHPEEFEDKDAEPPKNIDEREEAKRLQEEIEAAIAAITTGDKKGERLPNLFSVERAQSLRHPAGEDKETCPEGKKPEDEDQEEDDEYDDDEEDEDKED